MGWGGVGWGGVGWGGVGWGGVGWGGVGRRQVGRQVGEAAGTGWLVVWAYELRGRVCSEAAVGAVP